MVEDEKKPNNWKVGENANIQVFNEDGVERLIEKDMDKQCCQGDERTRPHEHRRKIPDFFFCTDEANKKSNGVWYGWFNAKKMMIGEVAFKANP